MRNLTPHAITIEMAGGKRVTIPPSGDVARVTTVESPKRVDQWRENDELARDLGCPGGVVIYHHGDGAIAVPVIERTFGTVEGMPEIDEPCIVSTMVLEALRVQQPWRRRVYAPDTGNTAIRDDAGRIVAVRRLVSF